MTLAELKQLRKEWEQRTLAQRDDLLHLFLENAWPTKQAQNG